MHVKTRLVGVMAAVIGLSAPVAAIAADEPAAESWIPGSFTGNVALTSDYVFRGISQNNENAAIQGGVDWDTGMGVYFGIWGSSVNFKDNSEASAEVDLYGGYAGTFGDAISYDVGFIYYWYPGAAKALDYDLWEVYGKAGYDFGFAAVNVGIAFSPNYFGGTDDAYYFSGGVDVPITDTVSVSGGINYSKYKAPLANYWDWNIGATLNVNNWFDIDVRYYDTDIPGSCLVASGKHWCDSKAVVTVSRSF